LNCIYKFLPAAFDFLLLSVNLLGRFVWVNHCQTTNPKVNDLHSFEYILALSCADSHESADCILTGIKTTH